MPAQTDRKESIRAELLRCARERRIIYYGELARAVGMSSQGPWKGVLDEISREEMAKTGVDITFLVINKKTGFPGQIGFEPAHPPTDEQRRMADEAVQKIFEYYSK